MRRQFVLCAVVLACASAAVAQNRTVRAADFSGDLGAQINAADHQLGSGPGTIAIDRPAEATTPVQLSSGHSLLLSATATFRAGMTLSGGNTISCRNGGSFVLALPQPSGHGNFLRAIGVTGITVQHCNISAQNPGGDYMFLHASGCTNVRMLDNHSDNVPLLFADSTTNLYNDVTPQTESHNIVFDHNVVTLDAPGYRGHQATAALLFYSTDLKVTFNQFHGGAHGVQYWGGDGNRNWKSEASPRWLQNLEISDNTCSDVRGSCYWGAMGENVQYLRNTAVHCGDACLDVEDNKDVVLSDNRVTDGGNGEIALLGRVVNIRILNNDLTSTSAIYPLFSLFNNSVAAWNSTGVTLEGNRMVCQDAQNLCVIKYENTQNFAFVRNQVTNGIIHPSTLWQQGTRISENTFTYTFSAPAPFFAINGSGQISGAASEILNNVILSNAPQPEGSECIHIRSLAPNKPPGRYVVEGNTCGGSNPFPIALDLQNAGRTGPASFLVQGNQFSGRILRQDLTGGARFDIRQ